MSLIRVWLSRCAAFFRRQELDEDLDAELQSHIEFAVEENSRRGMSAQEARTAALRSFGGVTQTMELYRVRQGLPFIETLAQDVRYSLRQLGKSPVFATTIILTLALGIGANSTIFSVLNSVLYRPLPYEHPERLVTIWQTEIGRPESLEPPPIAELNDWKMQSHAFEDIALTSHTQSSSISGLGVPEPIRLQYVTPTFFDVLKVKPVLGRVFVQGDLHEKEQTIVISNDYWKRRFNSDPNVLGKVFTIQGITSTVVGVMPAGFAPFYGDRIDLWWPINPYGDRYVDRIDHWLMPIARLKPDVSIEQAQSEMNVIARRLEQTHPETNTKVGKSLIGLQKVLFAWTKKELYPLMGAVAFVLVIACVNVASLLQSRTETRRKEYALRVTLGAGRGRLVRQLLTESGILALVGGGLGVGLTFPGIALFRSLAGNFPNAAAIHIDRRVLLFTLGISVLTAMLVGLAPAMHASRPDLNLALQEGDRRTMTTSRGHTRHLLAIAEVALAMVLLVGAGLMINTVLHLQRVNPGFDSKNVMTMEIQLPAGGKYVENTPGRDMGTVSPRVPAFYQQLLERTSTFAGVEAVGIVSILPSRGAESFTFAIEGKPASAPKQEPRTEGYQVSPGFFRALKIPLVQGRYLDDHDTQAAPWSVVINQSFARRYFPNENPIGQQLQLSFGDFPGGEEPLRRIVGIVGDTKGYLQQDTQPFIYVSYLQQPALCPGGTVEYQLHQTLVARMAPGMENSGGELTSAVKAAVASLDADQPVTDVMSLEDALSHSISGSRFYMRLLAIFAGIAALLAAIGIYGVLSYFVSERTHEIGIRLALGAHPWEVLTMIGKLGLKLTVIGVMLGTALSLGVTHLIAGFLFGVKPGDPATYGLVAIGLACISLFACYVPARRASRVNPLVTLRDH